MGILCCDLTKLSSLPSSIREVFLPKSNVTIRFQVGRFATRRHSERKPFKAKEAYEEDGFEPIFKKPDGGYLAVLNWLLYLPANAALACTIPDVTGRFR